MKTFLLAALLLPAAAVAQTTYSYVDRLPEVRLVPYYDTRTLPDPVRECVDRNDRLHERRDALERDRTRVESEAQALAREGAQLEAEWRALDRTNTAAVNAYNARSDRHNRLVQDQNARVARFNDRAARLNGDTDVLASDCGARLGR